MRRVASRIDGGMKVAALSRIIRAAYDWTEGIDLTAVMRMRASGTYPKKSWSHAWVSGLKSRLPIMNNRLRRAVMPGAR